MLRLLLITALLGIADVSARADGAHDADDQWSNMRRIHDTRQTVNAETKYNGVIERLSKRLTMEYPEGMNSIFNEVARIPAADRQHVLNRIAELASLPQSRVEDAKDHFRAFSEKLAERGAGLVSPQLAGAGSANLLQRAFSGEAPQQNSLTPSVRGFRSFPRR